MFSGVCIVVICFDLNTFVSAVCGSERASGEASEGLFPQDASPGATHVSPCVVFCESVTGIRAGPERVRVGGSGGIERLARPLAGIREVCLAPYGGGLFLI